MGILALAADERVADVTITEDELSVRLMDGRTISAPLAWFPRLLGATEAQRNNWQIAGGGYGIHWEEVDEDLSVEGLLRGAPMPRRPLTKTTLPPAQSETTADAGEGAHRRTVVTDEISEEPEEKGFLDYLTEFEDAGKELTAVLGWINDETIGVGKKIERHNTRIDQLKTRGGGARASDYKKVALLAASDMNAFSKRVEDVLPDFEGCVRRLDTNLSGYVSLLNPESSADVAQILPIRKSLQSLLVNVGPAKQSLSGFRDTALSLTKLNVGKEFTKAARRQSNAIGGVVRNIEEVESFALRANFQMEEKFGELPESDE